MLQLPIDAVLDEVVSSLNDFEQLILHAPPGAGKSTQLPFYLLSEASLSGKIILLEPRRIAARNIASFLALQLNQNIGETIGLRMRGETLVSERTRLEVVTEGILVQWIQRDPMLDGVSLVIFDEFHERSLHTDLGLALVLDVQGGLRDDLKLLIMSATLKNIGLAEFLPRAKIICSEGRIFPIEVRYQAPSPRVNLLHHAGKVIQHLIEKERGSVLVFLPSVADIGKLEGLLKDMLLPNVIIAPLFGQQTHETQTLALAPTQGKTRKIVLATNIAETSLTIEGVHIVVDLGLEKRPLFNRKTGITRLETMKISKASAIQRAGRAGRLSAGICVRLYSEEIFHRLRQNIEPEILNADLSSLLLEVKRWGCEWAALSWLTQPSRSNLAYAEQLLQQLDIIDPSGALTSKGKALSFLAIEPRLAAMLWQAKTLDESTCSDACWLAAWAEKPPKNKASLDLEHQLKAVANAHSLYFQRAKYFAKKLGITLKIHITGNNLDVLAASAWPDRVAKARGEKGRYLLSNGHGVFVEQDDVLSQHPVIVAVELMTFAQGDSRIFCACPSNLSNLELQLPQLFSIEEVVAWDDKKGKLVAERLKKLGNIVLLRLPIESITPAMQQKALLSVIQSKGFDVLHLSNKVRNLLMRAQCAELWQLDISLPAMNEEALMKELEHWLVPFLHGVKDVSSLMKVDVLSALEARIGWEALQKLNQWVPETFQVPTGSVYPITYNHDQSPTLAVRMQEMFGQTKSPTIANGKVLLRLELLSPAKRPLQITQDLEAFWQGAYQEVKKEMRGRYPKHIWPDDPANHQATKCTKRHFNSNT